MVTKKKKRRYDFLMTNPEGLVFAMRILTRVSKNTYNPNRLV